jgi:hypothetical protein
MFARNVSIRLKPNSIAELPERLRRPSCPYCEHSAASRRRDPMFTWQRVALWVGAIALVSFVLVLYGSVRTLQTTVQGHTAILDKPVLEAAVFPGVPAAFSDRWNTATRRTDLTPQDHLWLTLQITNIGQSQVRDIAADLVLPPAISALYPGSESLWRTPPVIAEHKGQTRAKFAFLSLAPGNAHTVFVALRPPDMHGPPYEAQAQRQWVEQYRAYWEQFTVTAGEKTTVVQYGFASPLHVRQAASDPAGASGPVGLPWSAARRAP